MKDLHLAVDKEKRKPHVVYPAHRCGGCDLIIVGQVYSAEGKLLCWKCWQEAEYERERDRR